MFKSKNHLLLHVSEIADRDDLQQFAEVVSENPLNDCKIKTKGSKESILESLRGVSKAVLEHSYDIVFEDQVNDSEEDEDEFSDDDSSYDDEEE
jgi:hypothetical protein